MTDQEINEAVGRKLGKGHIKDGWEKVCIIPDYCHSIQAAWEIFEKPNCFWTLQRTLSGYHCVVSCGLGGTGVAEADTAPMAICLAFLKLPNG